jgi:hypothetical protein
MHIAYKSACALSDRLNFSDITFITFFFPPSRYICNIIIIIYSSNFYLWKWMTALDFIRNCTRKVCALSEVHRFMSALNNYTDIVEHGLWIHRIWFPLNINITFIFLTRSGSHVVSFGDSIVLAPKGHIHVVEWHGGVPNSDRVNSSRGCQICGHCPGNS